MLGILGLYILLTGIPTTLNHEIKVTVTAYSPDEHQTDSTPLLTASQKRVSTKYVALSRDLESEYGLNFGDSVILNGVEYEFQDRMNKKWTKRVDRFFWSRAEALQFGKQDGVLEVVR